MQHNNLQCSTLKRNLIVPNQNYCDFEDWFTPLLIKMYDEQQENNTTWTPSKLAILK